MSLATFIYRYSELPLEAYWNIQNVFHFSNFNNGFYSLSFADAKDDLPDGKCFFALDKKFYFDAAQSCRGNTIMHLSEVEVSKASLVAESLTFVSVIISQSSSINITVTVDSNLTNFIL